MQMLNVCEYFTRSSVSFGGLRHRAFPAVSGRVGTVRGRYAVYSRRPMIPRQLDAEEGEREGTSADSASQTEPSRARSCGSAFQLVAPAVACGGGDIQLSRAWPG